MALLINNYNNFDEEGLHTQMKNRSKVGKSNIRINRNFFIFQGVLIGILLCLTWGAWGKFVFLVVLEIAAYFAFVYYLAKQANQNSKKKRAASKRGYNKVGNGKRQVEVFDYYREVRRKNRKNFNWEIQKSGSKRKVVAAYNNVRDKLDKDSQTSVNTGTLNENESVKNVLGIERRSFVPYRSPFDPIKPKEEEQKADTQNEILESSMSNEEENEPQDVEEIEIQQEEENIRINMDVNIDEDINENVSENENINENINEIINEDIEEVVDENSEENDEEEFLNLQMEYNRQNEIFNSELVYDNSTYDSSTYENNIYENNTHENITYDKSVYDNSTYDDIDADINITEKDEEDYQINQSFSSYRGNIEVLQNNIRQEDNKIGFEGEKSIPSTVLSREAEKDYRLVPPIPRDKKPLHNEEYRLPMELLNKNDQLVDDAEFDDYIEYNAYKLIDTLASFGVGAKILDVSRGPTVTRYEIQPNTGVKVSKILNLADDIALNLAATGVRIEAPIPGKAAVGIEIPNKKNVPVFLRDVVESDEFQNYPSKLAFAIGKDIAGNVVVGDIAKMPHLLIAGATGSGKSVCINTLIVSILYKASPKDVRLLMVDPKVVELGIYNGIPHLLIPVVTEPKKAAGALSWAVAEMTNRYKLFAENNVRDLNSYNEIVKERGEGETLPHIVIIIDELADLMMVAPNEVEDSICRLAQMARAAGMHLVIATQRPSVNVITGVIKANIPSRISFAVSSQIDSRTILDMAGAEKLLGRGDMLFYPLGQPKPIRVQGSFISDKEVDRIVTHIKSLQSADYDEEILKKIDNQNETPKPDTGGDDELLPQAIEMVLEMGQASASLIQRKFKVGYSRAARILDQMESWGVVSASDGSKPRQILITKQEWDELNA